MAQREVTPHESEMGPSVECAVTQALPDSEVVVDKKKNGYLL